MPAVTPTTERVKALHNASQRKLRLFACASVRAAWSLIDDVTPTDDQANTVLTMSEHFADDLIDSKHLAATRNALQLGSATTRARLQSLYTSRQGAYNAALSSLGVSPETTQRHLLDDIFGPVSLTIDRQFLTPDVLTMALAVYDDRQGISGTFDTVRLAILADALEEAGYHTITCDTCGGEGIVRPRDAIAAMVIRPCPRCIQLGNHEGDGMIMHPMIAHLRHPGPHVRGCWAIDLILGKE